MVLLWPNGSTSIPRVSSEYGNRFHPIDKVWRLHAGIDLVGFTYNKSPVDGVISIARYNGAGGNMITVRSGGANDPVYHLMHNKTMLVSVGQRVVAGQNVGIMGMTGSATGVHVHYEVHPQSTNASIDPRVWHATNGGGFAGGGGTVGSINSLGTAYVSKLQLALGVGPDGVAGPVTIKAIQSKVGTTADGIWGPNSTKALQRFIGAGVDGIWGNETTTKFKAAIDAGKFGPTGNLNVDLTQAEIKSLQTQLGVTADGQIGNATLNAIQKKVGAPVGAWTSASIKAVQTFTGATADGIWGNGTLSAFKAAIAASKFGKATIPTPEPEPPVTTLPAGYVYGIDIAWPQTATFDWTKVKAGNTFAIIKLAGAEGGIYGPADLADKHLTGVRGAGLRAGFYFFNNGNLNVKTQADKFIETLRTRIKPGDIVCLDIEPDGASVPQFTPAQALEFAEYIERALGVKTFMYINRTTMNTGDWSKVVAAGHPLWLAVLNGLDTSLKVEVKHWDKADIVQFEVGRIDGYPGDIDRNFTTVATLDEYGFKAFPVEPEDPSEIAELKATVLALTKQIDVLKAQIKATAKYEETLRTIWTNLNELFEES